MKALAIYAGPKAREKLAREGLSSADIRTVAGAAGGPKGLILGPLDRFLFGHWLPQSDQAVDLVGASIGACRMATACMKEPVREFERFERDYIAQHYPLEAGERRPPAKRVSALFEQSLNAWYADQLQALVHHPKYRLHVLTSRGRGPLARERGWRTVAGFAQAFLNNLGSRQALARTMERVVFSSPLGQSMAALPFDPDDFRTTQAALTERNVLAVLQASCSIPFFLEAVHDIVGAPAGAYWDGGLVDYHLHLNYKGLVLYPHFQKQVIPGWLDKYLRGRHVATAFLDGVVLLAPKPAWVARLPNGKLPDRRDFSHYTRDPAQRQLVWRRAVAASQELADEWAAWLERPDMRQVEPLN